MDFEAVLQGIRRFGSTDADACRSTLGVGPEQIRERVILAPWWEPDVFTGLGDAETAVNAPSYPHKVWQIRDGGMELTYIKTGIGAPLMLDVALALGLTACRRALFVGSVGALDPAMGIGDIVLPEYSVCGDGASRYLQPALQTGDMFGQKAYPNKDLFDQTVRITDSVCREHQVKWHIGRNFSIDTIFAQFAHIDEILALGCNTIEMETAAAFAAARLAGYSLAAVFSVSDNTLHRKSLLSGRSAEEMQYRKDVRRHLFPQILLETLR